MIKVVLHITELHAALREVELGKVDTEGNLRTVRVIRERKATPNEILLWHIGYGWKLSFDKVIGFKPY